MWLCLLLLFVSLCWPAASSGLPNGYVWGCLNISKALPFCDHRLPLAARVDDLVSRLTLEEQAGLLSANLHSKVDWCNNMCSGVARLGIPSYMNLVETNSAVASACYAEDKCATEFPGPMGLAASFNRTLWQVKGDVISTEMRAFNNLNWYRGTSDAPYSLIGLTGFGPNINIVRDPRFGRNSELPSEDPLLAGTYATHYVRGCQQGDDPNYLKMVSGLKHYDAYSVEDSRDSRSFNISAFDLWDTYLPQYRLGFVEGDAQAVMCSYSSINGVPSCANDFLLNQVMRGLWNRSDVLVATDCGALYNMINRNHYATSGQDAAAKAINSGVDLDMGDDYFSPVSAGGKGSLQSAVQQNLTSAATVAAALKRALSKRFRLGLFDPVELQPYTRIGAEAINSSQHQEVNLQAALQSMVLLKNTWLLPLDPGGNIAVVGPHAVSQRDLMEDYCGDQWCFDGSSNCIPTIGHMIAQYNTGGNTTVAKGVDMNSSDTSQIPAALAAARAADVVVLCLGIGNTEEHEGIDRTSITLPGQQEPFAQQVLALGKPVVLVLVNGGVVAVDTLIARSSSIVEAFYPSMRGAEALAMLLFGLANSWGKLPVTMYPASYTSQVDMYNFDMSKPPGRTYRYYTGMPLFPFGFGLSYTSFELDCSQTEAAFACTVRNTGTRQGDEVVMVYHRVSDAIRQNASHPVPLRQLVDFDRVSLGVGGTAPLSFTITDNYFVLTNSAGQEVIYPGEHLFDVSRGVGPSVTFSIVVKDFRVVRSNLA